MRYLIVAFASLFLLIGCSQPDFTLTVLHNNDAESQLINLGEGELQNYGGVAHFKSLTDTVKAWADGQTDGWIMLTSGDNFLAGPEWNASIEKGEFYDALAIDRLGYHALCLGNHDFDSGPATLAAFIDATGEVSHPWFLSCNLDFQDEPEMQALVGKKLAQSKAFDINGTTVGVIGVTTPNLSFVSATGRTVVQTDILAEVSAEVDVLTQQGAKIIILVSHLQGVEEDMALIHQLSGVDIVIAGGGDELLATVPDDVLIPGDESERYGDYPMYATDTDGHSVPVVTTRGNFGYLGVLVATFDGHGNLLRVDDAASGPRVVANEKVEGGVPPNQRMLNEVVTPVRAYVDDLGDNIIASSTVKLDGIRNHVRGQEANEGNLIADALLWNAKRLHAQFNAPEPEVAIQNGGGIRNDSYIPAGAISELTTFNMLPFGNQLCVVHDLSPQEVKDMLENAVSATNGGAGTGRFAQVAGLRFEYDMSRSVQVYAEDNTIAMPGERIRNVWLDDGTVLVKDGVVNDDAPHIDVACGDFLARGGDQYPLFHKPRTLLGISDQQALAAYLRHIGKVTAKDYPLSGEGRSKAVSSR